MSESFANIERVKQGSWQAVAVSAVLISSVLHAWATLLSKTGLKVALKWRLYEAFHSIFRVGLARLRFSSRVSAMVLPNWRGVASSGCEG